MRKKLFIIGAVLFLCGAVFFLFYFREKPSGIMVDGQPIEHWEALALINLPQGKEAAVTKVLAKMGPETIPFWLNRLETRDSGIARVYQEAWEMAPAFVQQMLPQSVPQETRRNVAFFHLSKLPCTNGVPELIRLGHSSDQEVQFYAVSLLSYLAYTGFFEPSRESPMFLPMRPRPAMISRGHKLFRLCYVRRCKRMSCRRCIVRRPTRTN